MPILTPVARELPRSERRARVRPDRGWSASLGRDDRDSVECGVALVNVRTRIPRLAPSANRSPGPIVTIGLVGLAVLVFLAAQLNVALALVMIAGILLGGVVVVLGRVEYLLNLLMITALIEGLQVGPVTTGRVAAFGSLVAVIGMMVLTDWRPVRTPFQLWLPSVLLLSWAVLSGLWSASTDAWLLGLAKMAVGVCVLVVTALTLRGPTVFTSMMRTYVVAASLICVPATLQVLQGKRAVGLGGGPNALATALVMAVLALAYLVRLRGFRRSRALLFCCAPLLVFGVVATGSRAGLLGLLFAGLLVAYDVAPKQNRGRVVFASALVMLVSLTGALSVSGLAAGRFDPAGAFEDRGAGRLDLWSIAIRQVEDAPLHGMGLLNFGTRAADLLAKEPGVSGYAITDESKPVHNQYLDFLVNLGIVGLALYLWTVGRAMMAAWLCPDEWRGPANTLIVQMFAVLSFLLFFGSAINNKHLWLLIGTSIAMHALPDRRPAAGSARVRPSLKHAPAQKPDFRCDDCGR